MRGAFLASLAGSERHTVHALAAARSEPHGHVEKFDEGDARRNQAVTVCHPEPRRRQKTRSATHSSACCASERPNQRDVQELVGGDAQTLELSCVIPSERSESSDPLRMCDRESLDSLRSLLRNWQCLCGLVPLSS